MFGKLLYSAVPDLEQEDEKEDHSFIPQHQIARTLRVSLLRIYVLLIHVFLVLSGILISWPEINNSCVSYKLWQREIPWAKSIVQYEEVTFAPSGFSKGPEPATLYEGIPTPEIDERWHHLMSVGMYSLTPSEYKELDLDTAQVFDHPDQYLVTIEVFHQLHCLNYLREAVYGTSNPKESNHSKSMHLAHCTDYLRQVLMCHGDLSLITLHQDLTRSPPYMPDFNIKHTCRNFDAIWDFAAERNISGIKVET